MRVIILISFFLSLMACSEPVEHNCADFKTGKFKVNKVDSLISETLITRSKQYQIEEFTQYYKRDFEGKLIKKTSKHLDSFTVKWVNDCEFVLKKIHPKNRIERKAFFVRILTTTKDSYYFEGRFEDNKSLTYQTAYRIKKD